MIGYLSFGAKFKNLFSKNCYYNTFYDLFWDLITLNWFERISLENFIS